MKVFKSVAQTFLGGCHATLPRGVLRDMPKNGCEGDCTEVLKYDVSNLGKKIFLSTGYSNFKWVFLKSSLFALFPQSVFRRLNRCN